MIEDEFRVLIAFTRLETGECPIRFSKVAERSGHPTCNDPIGGVGSDARRPERQVASGLYRPGRRRGGRLGRVRPLVGAPVNAGPTLHNPERRRGPRSRRPGSRSPR